jgi:hypothetical protein
MSQDKMGKLDCGIIMAALAYLRQTKTKIMSLNHLSQSKKRIKNSLVFALAIFFISLRGEAQQNPVSSSKDYFTIEYYYKVKWGLADEFIDLWKTNHYPLLKKALEKGDIISITASKPKLHSGEDTRWDFRVAIVFRNALLAFDENLTTPFKKQLYPDQEAYIKAEHHRFEILLAHWDIEVGNVPLN